MTEIVPYAGTKQPTNPVPIRKRAKNRVLSALIPTALLFTVILLSLLYHQLSPSFTSLFPHNTPTAQQFTPIPTPFQSQQADPPEPEYRPCSDVSKEKEKCAFAQQWCEKSSLIGYINFRYCVLESLPSAAATLISVVLFSVLLILLLSMLGGTSDVFFVPALESLSSELKVSPTVAGLTLLAIGNGAPDILTSLTAVSKGAARGEIGLVLGSMSGASMCILNLIFGTAVITAVRAYPNGNPTKLSKGQFLRAMVGIICCVLPSIALCIPGNLHWWSAVILLVCYLAYIILNVVYLQRQEAKKRKIAEEKRRQSYITSTSSYQVTQSSKSLRDNLLAFDDGLFETAEMTGHNLNSSMAGESPSYAMDDIDTEPDHEIEVETTDRQTEQQIPVEISAQTKPRFSIANLLQTSMRHLLDDEDEEDSQPSPRTPRDTGSGTELTDLQQMDENGNPTTYTQVADENTEHHHDNDDNDDDDDDDEDQTYFMSGLHQDSAWSKPGKKSIGTVLSIGFSRVLWFLTWPMSLLRWLSVPSTDVRPDYLRGLKLHFLLFSPILLSFILGMNLADFESEDTLVWVILIVAGIGLAVSMNLAWYYYILPTTRKYNKRRKEVQNIVADKKDEDYLDEQQIKAISELVLEYNIDQDDVTAKPWSMKIFMILCSVLAFIASIAWLSLIANELVEILSALGIMFNISSIFLGITVLALGNSVVDLVANMTLARQNKMNVAYSAMWSAPITACSFGFGLAILFTTLTDVPVISFEITKPIIFCWCFVVGAVVLACVLMPIWQYKPNVKFGLILVVYYVIFLVGSTILEFGFKS